jgi:hypothetical protein
MRQRSCSPDWREYLGERKAAFSVVAVNVKEAAFPFTAFICNEVRLTRMENLTLKANGARFDFWQFFEFCPIWSEDGKSRPYLLKTSRF